MNSHYLIPVFRPLLQPNYIKAQKHPRIDAVKDETRSFGRPSLFCFCGVFSLKEAKEGMRGALSAATCAQTDGEKARKALCLADCPVWTGSAGIQQVHSNMSQTLYSAVTLTVLLLYRDLLEMEIWRKEENHWLDPGSLLVSGALCCFTLGGRKRTWYAWFSSWEAQDIPGMTLWFPTDTDGL